MAQTGQLEELQNLIAAHAVPGAPWTTLPGVKALVSTAPSAPFCSIYQPAFGLVVQGAKRSVLNDRLFDYGAGQYLVVSVDLPIMGHVTEATPEKPYLAMSMVLEPATIASLLLEVADRPAAEGAAGIAVSDAPPDLLDSVTRLMRLLDRPGDVPVLLPLLRREIHWRLLNGAQGATIRQIGLADSRLSQVARAIAHIREHFAEPLSMEALAHLAGMSGASFNRHFRAVTAMSPLQFQKQVRLQEARSRLLTSAEDAAAIGFAVGYSSASQFTREYGRLFGAPPARDMSRLRGMPAVERGLA